MFYVVISNIYGSKMFRLKGSNITVTSLVKKKWKLRFVCRGVNLIKLLCNVYRSVSLQIGLWLCNHFFLLFFLRFPFSFCTQKFFIKNYFVTIPAFIRRPVTMFLCSANTSATIHVIFGISFQDSISFLLFFLFLESYFFL